jgi:hypothetical protein
MTAFAETLGRIAFFIRIEIAFQISEDVVLDAGSQRPSSMMWDRDGAPSFEIGIDIRGLLSSLRADSANALGQGFHLATGHLFAPAKFLHLCSQPLDLLRRHDITYDIVMHHAIFFN